MTTQKTANTYNKHLNKEQGSQEHKNKGQIATPRPKSKTKNTGKRTSSRNKTKEHRTSTMIKNKKNARKRQAHKTTNKDKIKDDVTNL